MSRDTGRGERGGTVKVTRWHIRLSSSNTRTSSRGSARLSKEGYRIRIPRTSPAIHRPTTNPKTQDSMMVTRERRRGFALMPGVTARQRRQQKRRLLAAAGTSCLPVTDKHHRLRSRSESAQQSMVVGRLTPSKSLAHANRIRPRLFFPSPKYFSTYHPPLSPPPPSTHDPESCGLVRTPRRPRVLSISSTRCMKDRGVRRCQATSSEVHKSRLTDADAACVTPRPKKKQIDVSGTKKLNPILQRGGYSPSPSFRNTEFPPSTRSNSAASKLYSWSRPGSQTNIAVTT